MKEPTKAARKHFRELAALAHERELGKVLDELFSEFDRWKKGEINAFELNERIHQYHQGISRKLWGIHVDGDPMILAARAILEGILQREDVDERFLPDLEPTIDYFRQRE